MSETAPPPAGPTPPPADATPPGDTPPPTDAPPAGEDALGDAGKRALDAMKAERKAAKDQAATEKARADELQARLDGKEAEHKAAQEAQKIRDDALNAANQRILKAEIRAAAAGKLADPTDALQFIDLSALEVGADGDVDATAITALITDLIEKKPYLAAQGKRFQGTADGGARNDAAGPTQLNQSDLDRMSPAEVDQAHREGRFDQLLGAK